jgi:vitamin K-dependent gamma-carboxylase
LLAADAHGIAGFSSVFALLDQSMFSDVISVLEMIRSVF